MQEHRRRIPLAHEAVVHLFRDAACRKRSAHDGRRDQEHPDECRSHRRESGQSGETGQEDFRCRNIGDEYRLHMRLWSIYSATLLAGNDLRTMADEIKSILMNAEVIAVSQDKAVKPAKKISDAGTSVIIAKLLADG